MATWHLPDDAVYVITYEYWSPKHRKWVSGQPKAYPDSKTAARVWAGFQELIGLSGKYRNAEITPINVYKE